MDVTELKMGIRAAIIVMGIIVFLCGLGLNWKTVI